MPNGHARRRLWHARAHPRLINLLGLPYILAPGILGEGSLTLWLVVVALNAQNWNDLANARRVAAA